VKILFDTNIVLDVLLKRQPHVLASAQLFIAIENRRLTGFLAATTVTTIHYLAAKVAGRQHAQQHLTRLLTLFTVAPVTQQVITEAMLLPFGDFEDAVLHECARHAGVDGIVTRNSTDFTHAILPVYAPEEMLRVLHARD